MRRQTILFLIAISAIAFVVINTNNAIGNSQLEAALTRSKTMRITHTQHVAAVPVETRQQITATFGENTKNIDSKDVLVLQTYLVAHNFLKPKYITGEFGPITKQAVKDFQVANNISPATGFVGEQTIAIINTSLR